MAKHLLLLILVGVLLVPTAAQDKTPYAIALERIEAARVSGATQLDLNDLGLTELPPEIGQLTNLQTLYLYNNQLTELPPEIGQLANLQTLYLEGNQLRTLPPEIGQLANLQTLYLGRNLLSALPPEIGQLTNLQVLSLYNNQVSVFPPEIGQLTSLSVLWLRNVQLSELPPEIGQLEQLCWLDLRYNRLRELPTEIGALPRLTEPGCGILLNDNPLLTPPPEVIVEGTAAVQAYLRDEAGYHMRQIVLSAAGGVGIFASVILLARWRYRRNRKPKKKNGLRGMPDAEASG